MYASALDLLDRYPETDLAQLTDPAGQAIDEGKLSRALADASAEIDGYLLGRYRLPLPSAPTILKLIACDIAIYRLTALRPVTASEDGRKRYEDAIAYLGRVSKGTVQLSLSETSEEAPQSAGPEVITATRTFTRDAMRDG